MSNLDGGSVGVMPTLCADGSLQLRVLRPKASDYLMDACLNLGLFFCGGCHDVIL